MSRFWNAPRKVIAAWVAMALVLMTAFIALPRVATSAEDASGAGSFSDVSGQAGSGSSTDSGSTGEPVGAGSDTGNPDAGDPSAVAKGDDSQPAGGEPAGSFGDAASGEKAESTGKDDSSAESTEKDGSEADSTGNDGSEAEPGSFGDASKTSGAQQRAGTRAATADPEAPDTAGPITVDLTATWGRAYPDPVTTGTQIAGEIKVNINDKTQGSRCVDELVLDLTLERGQMVTIPAIFDKTKSNLGTDGTHPHLVISNAVCGTAYRIGFVAVTSGISTPSEMTVGVVASTTETTPVTVDLPPIAILPAPATIEAILDPSAMTQAGIAAETTFYWSFALAVAEGSQSLSGPIEFDVDFTQTGLGVQMPVADHLELCRSPNVDAPSNPGDMGSSIVPLASRFTPRTGGTVTRVDDDTIHVVLTQYSAPNPAVTTADNGADLNPDWTYFAAGRFCIKTDVVPLEVEPNSTMFQLDANLYNIHATTTGGDVVTTEQSDVNNTSRGVVYPPGWSLSWYRGNYCLMDCNETIALATAAGVRPVNGTANSLRGQGAAWDVTPKTVDGTGVFSIFHLNSAKFPGVNKVQGVQTVNPSSTAFTGVISANFANRDPSTLERVEVTTQAMNMDDPGTSADSVTWTPVTVNWRTGYTDTAGNLKKPGTIQGVDPATVRGIRWTLSADAVSEQDFEALYKVDVAQIGDDVWVTGAARFSTDAGATWTGWQEGGPKNESLPGDLLPQTTSSRDVFHAIPWAPTVEKSTPVNVPEYGQKVPYTITTGPRAVVTGTDQKTFSYDLLDVLPAGMSYVTGSASIPPDEIVYNTDNPRTAPVENNVTLLTWRLNDIAANANVSITYEAVAGFYSGSQTNTAWVAVGDQTWEAYWTPSAANDGVATATVTRTVDGSTRLNKTSSSDAVAIDAPATWTITLLNNDTLTQQVTDVIDILPWNGDGRDTDFVGDYTLGAITASDGARVYYSTAAPATINPDPAHASNGGFGTPSGSWSQTRPTDSTTITAIRFVGANLVAGALARYEIPWQPTESVEGNVYDNYAWARTTSTTLSMIRADAAVTVEPPSTLQVDKGTGTFNPATGKVTFPVTVKNGGENTVTSVTVTDSPVAFLENATFSNPSTGSISGAVWSIARMAPGASATATVTADVTDDVDTVTDTITNSVTVESPKNPYKSGKEPNETVDGDTDQYDESSLDLPALRVDKSAATWNAVANTLTYTVTVKNAGKAAETGVVVTDKAATKLQPGTFSNPSKGSASGATWTVGDLAVGESATATVVTKLATGFDARTDVAGNEVTAKGALTPLPEGADVPNDGVDEDRDQFDRTDTPLPYLQVDKANPVFDPINRKVTYDVTVKNAGKGDDPGPVTATDAGQELTDPVFSNLSAGTASGATWTIPSLKAGAQATAKVTATLVTGFDPRTDVTLNTVKVSSPADPYVNPNETRGEQPNDSVAGDTDQYDEIEFALPYLQVDKTHARYNPQTGALTWTITAKNAGLGPDTNVVVNDAAGEFVDGLTLTSPSKGSVSGANWNVGTLAPNETATVTASAKVADDFDARTDRLTNKVTVSGRHDPYVNPNETRGEQPNATVATDDDQFDSDELLLPYLEIDKSNPVWDGWNRTLTWKVTVKNAGLGDDPQPDQGPGPVTVTDFGGEFLTNVTLSKPTYGTVNGLVWTIPDLAWTQDEQVTVTARVAAGFDPATDGLTNDVEVTSWLDPRLTDTENPNPNVDADDDQYDTVTTYLPDLKINKDVVRVSWADDARTTVKIHWSIEVLNNGLAAATNTRINDILPAGTTALTDESAATAGNFHAEKLGGADAQVVWTIPSLGSKHTALLDLVTLIPVEAIDIFAYNQASVTSEEDPYRGGTNSNETLLADDDQYDNARAEIPEEPPVGPKNPGITVVKTANRQIANVGQQVQFRFAVTNTGNMALEGFTLSDPVLDAAGVSYPTTVNATLQPGESHPLIVAGYYTVTQADADRGYVLNKVTVTGDPEGTEWDDRKPTDDDSVGVDVPGGEDPPGTPDIEVAKTADKQVVIAGTKVVFTFTITNNGDVPLTSVDVSDPLLDAAGVSYDKQLTGTELGSDQVLSPDESVTVSTGEYTVTAEDLAGHRLSNTVSVVGDPEGDQYDDDKPTDDDTIDIPEPEGHPAIQVVKTADKAQVSAGDEIVFTLVITNTGNVNLTSVDVSDPVLDAAGVDYDKQLAGAELGADGLLTPGEAITLITGEYTVTTDDVRQGYVHNTVLVVGDPEGTAMDDQSPTDDDDVLVDTVGQPAGDPDIRVVKTADKATVKAGDKVRFTFTVTNTGDVTLSSVDVRDAVLDAAGVSYSDITDAMEPGDVVTLTTGEYTVTAADAARGYVLNTVVVEGDPEGDDYDDQKPTDDDDIEIPAGENPPPPGPKPGINVVKTANSAVAKVGDRIRFYFLVTNTGDVNLTSVEISDPMLDAAGVSYDTQLTGTELGSDRLFTPAEDLTVVTGEYTVTAADAAAGRVLNTVVVTGDPEGTEFDDNAPTDDDDTTVPVEPVQPPKTPGVQVIKTADTALVHVGDEVTYSFRVKNTGNVTLTSVDVSDPKLEAAGVSVPDVTTPLAPGAEVTVVSGRYTVTEADLTDHLLQNVVTVTGDPEGTDLDDQKPTDTDNLEIPGDDTPPPPVKHPRVTVEKSADSAIVKVGDKVRFSFTVTNTGDITLTSVDVSDPKLEAAGVNVPDVTTPLAPGASTTVTSGEYTVTAADLADHLLQNVVTVTGDPEGSDYDDNKPTDDDDLEIPDSPTMAMPRIEVVKTANKQLARAGDRIRYYFAVTNTGNVVLSSVDLTDAMLAAAGVSVPDINQSLLPKQTVTVVSGEYTVTAADVAAGRVDNTVTAVGDPEGTENDDRKPTDSDDETVPTSDDPPPTSPPPTSPPPTSPPPTSPPPTVPPSGNPAVSVIKTADKAVVKVGDKVRFSFLVKNTGDVTLTSVDVQDEVLTKAGVSVPDVTSPLAPGQSVTVTSGEYTVTAADLEDDLLQNRVSVTGDPEGTDYDNDKPTDSDDLDIPVEDVPTPPEPPVGNPDVSVIKTADRAVVKVGDTVRFSFLVKNTGDVTLTSVDVQDELLARAGVSVPDVTSPLAPGQSVTVTSGEYTVTAADLEDDLLQNRVSVTGDPEGTDYDHDKPTDSDDLDIPSEDGPPVPPGNPDVSVIKTADRAVVKVGDKVRFSFLVKNTGDVTLTSVDISDAKLAAAGVTVPDVTSPLAPGAQVTVTSGEYTVTAADLTDGLLRNVVTVTGDPEGTDYDNDKPTDDDDLVVPGEVTPPTPGYDPDVRVIKTADKAVVKVGDKVRFSFLVKNTGDVTLTSVDISDDLLSAAGVDVPDITTPLAPGQSVTVTSGEYTVTATDLEGGMLVNSVTVTGDPEGTQYDNDPPTDDDDLVIPSEGTEPPAVARLEIVKTANRDQVKVGDKVRYYFAVTNTGNVTLTSVDITDAKLAAAGVNVPDITAPLAPGQTTTVASGEYTVTAEDLADGLLQNTAIATGTPPDGGTPATDEDDSIVPGTPQQPDRPGISLEKTASRTTVTVGDKVRFFFTVTNTGNVMLTSVDISDAKLAAAGVTVPDVTQPLAPGQSVTLASGEYTVTAADLADDLLQNVATAVGDPEGTENDDNPPTDSDDLVIPKTPVTPPTPGGEADVMVVKTANKAVVRVGDKVRFYFAVTNTGDVTLTSVDLVDAKLGEAGVTVPDLTQLLAPGQTVTVSSGEYTVTAEDLADGLLQNSVTVTGDPEGGGTPPTDTDEIEVPGEGTPPPAGKPGVDVVKTADKPLVKVGDKVRFSFAVTNTGNVVLTSVDVRDPKLEAAGVSVPDVTTPLQPGQTVTVTSGEYTVTAADLEDNMLQNKVTVVGDPEGTEYDGNPPSDDDELVIGRDCNCGVDPSDPSANPDIAVVKTANKALVRVGDKVTFTFTVTNTGNVTLSSVDVQDEKLAAAGVAVPDITTALEPGQRVTVTSGEYTVTEADLADGLLQNSVTVVGDPEGTDCDDLKPSDTDDVVIPKACDCTVQPWPAPPTLDPDVSVVKTADQATVKVGDKVRYFFAVTNTGSVTLSSVDVQDEKLAAAGVAVPDVTEPLAPGQSTTVVSGEYTVTAADVAEGALRNHVVVIGDPEGTDYDDVSPEGSDDEVVPVQRENGKNLEVGNVAVGSLTRTYGWDIAKTVDRTSAAADADGNATFYYTVTATPGAASDSLWVMTGEISVANPNPWAVPAMIAADPQLGSGATCQLHDAAGQALVGTTPVPANGTAEFTYSCTFSGIPADGSYTVTASWDDTANGTPAASAEESVAVDAEDWDTTKVNETVTVVDNKVTLAEPVILGNAIWNAARTPAVFSYDLVLPTGEHRNTAAVTAEQTGKDPGDSVPASVPVFTWDQQVVEVTPAAGAPELGIAATATVTRSYDWKLGKRVDKTEATADAKGTANATYTVTATPNGYTDSGAQVSGTATIANPPPSGSRGALVVTLPGTTCQTGDVNAAAVDGRVEVPFTCTGTPTGSGQVSAQLSYSGGAVTAAPVTPRTTLVERHKTVVVADDKTIEGSPVVLGVATWNDQGTPTEFTYTLPLRAPGSWDSAVEYVNQAFVVDHPVTPGNEPVPGTPVDVTVPSIPGTDVDVVVTVKTPKKPGGTGGTGGANLARTGYFAPVAMLTGGLTLTAGLGFVASRLRRRDTEPADPDAQEPQEV